MSKWIDELKKHPAVMHRASVLIDIADELDEQLRAQRLTPSDLAERSGVGLQSVRELLAGDSGSLPDLIAVTYALGIELLLQEKNEN